MIMLLLLCLMLCACSNSETPDRTTVPRIDQKPTDSGRWETIYTDDSTCFTVIAYCISSQELQVQFRNSGAWYSYYGVEYSTWKSFKNADSHGGYYNDYIKNDYECVKLEG